MKVVAFDGSNGNDGNAGPKQSLNKKKLIRMITGAAKLFKVRNEKLPVICIFGHDDLEL